MLSSTESMRNTITIVIIALISCFGCDQKDALSEGSWIIIEGTYKGQNIDFVSTDLIQFGDINGNINADLSFFEDGIIILPGINSPDIRANWQLADSKLHFSVDTAKYNFIYNMQEEPGSLSSLIVDNPKQKVLLDSLARIDSINLKNWQMKNPLLTNEFEGAMKIYSAPFDIELNGDNLVLTSKTTSFKAIKDRSIDKLFEGL